MADKMYTNMIMPSEGGCGLTQDRYTTLELFNSARRDVERFINQPAIRESIENHKSNWVPDSKGGEPNCRREK